MQFLEVLRFGKSLFVLGAGLYYNVLGRRYNGTKPLHIDPYVKPAFCLPLLIKVGNYPIEVRLFFYMIPRLETVSYRKMQTLVIKCSYKSK